MITYSLVQSLNTGPFKSDSPILLERVTHMSLVTGRYKGKNHQ